MLSVSCKLTGVEQALKNLSSKKLKQAVRSTLDKTATEGKREITKAVAQDYNIRSTDIRNLIKVNRTTQTNLEASLRILREKLKLTYPGFRTRQTKTGVISHVRKRSGEFHKSAFIVDRWGKVMIRRGKRRLPITHRAGPAVTEILAKERYIDPIKAKLNRKMQELFPQEIKKRMGR